MTNTYRATSPLAEALIGGFAVDEFEHEFTPAEEKDHLDGGLLELVPRAYEVLSNNYERPQGETFDAAFPVEIEAALISGGHIKRADKPAPAKKTTAAKKPAAEKKE